MSTEHWMTEYEQAFQACNGYLAKVVICGGGWYYITRLHSEPAAFPGVRTRFRKATIVAMTANLERRAAGLEQR